MQWKLYSWLEFQYLFCISVVYQLTQDVSGYFLFPLDFFFSIVNCRPLTTKGYFLISTVGHKLLTSGRQEILDAMVAELPKRAFSFLFQTAASFQVQGQTRLCQSDRQDKVRANSSSLQVYFGLLPFSQMLLHF